MQDSGELRPRNATIMASIRRFTKRSRKNWFVALLFDFVVIVGTALVLSVVIKAFLIRSFYIPSGSMMPTLLAGDYILVNKFNYGIRLPILNNTLVALNTPNRGDVIVFHYPPDTSIDYIKRVIGLPGDRIKYIDKALYINDAPVDYALVGDYEYVMTGLNMMTAKQYREQLGDVSHDILIHDLIGNYDSDSLGAKLANGEEIIVPTGQYFAMGDNRDNSSDGRVWGFVPDKNLVGKAFFIWMNFSQLNRIGRFH